MTEHASVIKLIAYLLLHIVLQEKKKTISQWIHSNMKKLEKIENPLSIKNNYFESTKNLQN